ncbi:Egd2p, partial [Ascoidea rubescens DSM 1968]
DEIPAGAEVSIFSKNEKKARKLISKLNLKKVEGIQRVTFKRKGNSIFAIDKPDVYRSAAGTYVVFGEAKAENLAQRYQQAAAAQAKLHEQSAAPASTTDETDLPLASKDADSITADLQSASLKDKPAPVKKDEGPVDETGLDANDIDIVVEQTNVSRAQAVKALRENDGDMVNAIMSLS